LNFSLTKQHVNSIVGCTSPFEKIQFPSLLRAVRERLGATLSIYDVETSNFRNTWNFGITELSMLHIKPDGSMYLFSSLFDPGYPIKPIVVEKTGITDQMVAGAPLWKDLGAPLFHYLSSKGNYLLGYNNKSFDRQCIIDSNSACKSCCAIVQNEREYDLLPVATKFFGRRVKLEDAARRLGMDTSLIGNAFHRASADVVATAYVADKIIEAAGLDKLFPVCGEQRLLSEG
jgi:DNA polymerase III epsilon subunit-like protein